MPKNDFLDHKTILAYWNELFGHRRTTMKPIKQFRGYEIEVAISSDFNPVFAIGANEFKIDIDKQIGSLHVYTKYYPENDSAHLIIEYNDFNKRLYFSVFCSALFTELTDMPMGASACDFILRFCEKWKDYFKDPSDPFAVGVLGEFIIYSKLFEKGIITEGNWNLAQHSIQDFALPNDIDLEVKTVCRHYGYIVGIHGESQLQITPGHRLFLAFVRLEGVAGKGEYSIDKLLSRTPVSDDIYRILLDIKDRNRARTYNLREILFFEVTADFPRITTETLSGIKEYKRLSNISYDLDLSDMPSMSLESFLGGLV